MSIFNKIKLSRPKRSLHNLSYSMKLSLGYGDLVPIICEKVVPGDKFTHSHEFLLRMSPFVSQVYQAFDVRVDYFFVPSRLLWDNFEKFLVEDDNSVYPHPSIPLSFLYDGQNTVENTIIEYLGLPAGQPTWNNGVFQLQPIDGSQIGFSVDALPFAALLKIYLDYYVDENLLYDSNTQTDFEGFVQWFEECKHGYNGDGYGVDILQQYAAIRNLPTAGTGVRDAMAFFKKAYPKDYFTSALPWAQRGPIVQIPLNGSGDVQVYTTAQGARTTWENVYAEFNASPTPTEVDVTLRRGGDMGVSAASATTAELLDGQTAGNRRISGGYSHDNESQSDFVERLKKTPVLKFRAVNVNGTATITDLRTAMTVQAWLEKNARAGVRYKEQLASHFGVRSKDYRLDRAELLQSTKSRISIGEVFTTASDDSSTFTPGLGVATGTGSAAVRPFKHFFEEHGYMIGLMCVYPKAAYSQGIRRQMLELDKFDYYWPEFQHIGEQEIMNCELFLNDDSPDANKQTFGYTPRYAHYKHRNSEVHGDMVNTLNFMTASRQLTSQPYLNMDFININPDLNHLYRTFNAVAPIGNALPVQVDFFHNFKALRPMSYFGSPRII